MMVEFRTLRAFVEVVRQGGFSQAAKTVFATQSTVSKAVKQLEEEVGMPLLDRIGHHTRLTAAGEVVYPRAVRLLAERENLLGELEELRGLKRGTLRLGVPPVGSSTVFAALFATYRKRYPGVDIRLSEHGSDHLEEALLSGEIELGASLLPTSEGFEYQPVRREPLTVVVPANHAFAKREFIDFAALRESPFVLYSEGFAINRIVADACRRHGFEPQVVARSSSVDFIVELVAAGLGVAFVPRMIIQEQPRSGVSSVLLAEPGMEWHLAMIWRRDAYLSHAAKAWLELVREATAAGS
jgi:DNA-binding transcriptional LysR family regulator